MFGIWKSTKGIIKTAKIPIKNVQTTYMYGLLTLFATTNLSPMFENAQNKCEASAINIQDIVGV